VFDHDGGDCTEAECAEGASMSSASGPKVQQLDNHLFIMTDEVSNMTTREVVTGYNVYRSLTPGPGYDLIAEVNGSTTAYLDEDVENLTTYYYVITAIWEEILESEYSNEASATPEPYEAVAPENLTAEAGDAQVTLNWDASDSGGNGGGNGEGFPVCPDGSAEYIDCADTCFNDADCTGGCLNWLADGYCDDGEWGLVFWIAGGGCPEWGNDCGDCEALDDPYGVCDGTCEYPEENFDCAGNCLIEEDCNGVCGGSATEDECGVCEGPGSIYNCGCVGYTVCWDGTEVCDIAECPDQPLESTTLWISDVSNNQITVNLFNEEPVAGFQFALSIDGATGTLNGASGGLAQEAGFTVNAQNGIVLGFSFTGAVIPVGQGVLTIIDFTTDEELTNAVFDLREVTLSDVAGVAIDFDLGDPFLVGDVVFGCIDDSACNYDASANFNDTMCDYSCYGCTDETATNYDSDATIDDGSCFYEELEVPTNLTATAGDSQVQLDWNAPGTGGGGGGDDGPCSGTFMVYGSDPSGTYYGDCWSDGTGYFYFEWEGGCTATNLIYSAGDMDLTAYGFTGGFYFYGFDPGVEETFAQSFDAV
jgi:hypothetical protein